MSKKSKGKKQTAFSHAAHGTHQEIAPQAVIQQGITQAVRELAGTDKCCQICGDLDYKEVIMNNTPGRFCADCIQIQENMYGSVVEG